MNIPSFRAAGIQLLQSALAITLCGAATVHADILYVDDDAPPGGDGLSWTSPLRFLQDALTLASDSPGTFTEIHIAGGVYKPDHSSATPDGSGDPNDAFDIDHGPTLKGGYLGLAAGPGEDPESRDVTQHETVLSGDLLDNDDPDFANYGDNAFVLLRVPNSGSGSIDGLTVSSAQASGVAVHSEANVDATDCIFELNKAVGIGAGMESDTDCIRCVFRKNRRGMSFFEAGASFVDCDFIDNAAEYGAAINIGEDGGLMSATRCTFTNNIATEAGGAIFARSATFWLFDCVFKGNHAQRGGAIAIGREAHAFATRCAFRHNQAQERGGAIASKPINNENSFELINCIFFHNTVANGYGGAVHAVRTTTSLINCTLVDNQASSGGGVFSASSATASIRNCIIKANPGGPFGGSGERTVKFSNITGGHAGLGNINANPLFVNANTGNLRLKPGSLCIDAGRNSYLPDTVTTDFDGLPRFVDDPATPDTGNGPPPIVDMGAFEFQP